MTEENISQEFRLKNIHETKTYFIAEIKQNELLSKKHKMVCTTLNYIEPLLILVSTLAGCVFISAFASLSDISVGIASFAAEIKFWAITAVVKKYKSIIKKKRKKP